MYTTPSQQHAVRPTGAVAQPPDSTLQSPSNNRGLRCSQGDVLRRLHLFLSAANMPGLRRIRIDVSGDTVILSGRVRTFYERQTAVERSQRVAGVIQVDDQIEVVG